MTIREWRLYKIGLPKDRHYLVKNDWQLHLLEGPESAVRFAFDLDAEKHKHTIAWLAKEMAKFKIKTPDQLFSWSQFILAVHPLHKYHETLSTLGQLKELKQCLTTSLQVEANSSVFRKKLRKKRS